MERPSSRLTNNESSSPSALAPTSFSTHKSTKLTFTNVPVICYVRTHLRTSPAHICKLRPRSPKVRHSPPLERKNQMKTIAHMQT
jgi:hypothetical protein